jgi:hypothetical protein
MSATPRQQRVILSAVWKFQLHHSLFLACPECIYEDSIFLTKAPLNNLVVIGPVSGAPFVRINGTPKLLSYNTLILLIENAVFFVSIDMTTFTKVDNSDSHLCRLRLLTTDIQT